jgi:quercetin dioxygenase-like cupin family protein
MGMKQIQHDLLDQTSLTWHHYREDPDYPYPVSYWGTILDMDDAGHISVVYRWDPGSFCHFHRHLCAATSLVLQGELHVKTYEDGELVSTKIRRAGDYAKKPSGDVHMEQGGPNGALVLFELYAPDGQLTEQLDQDGNAVRTLTTDQLRHAFAKQQAAA